jgi:hypothetical protein
VPDPYLNSVLEAIADDAIDTESPRLISVDELRAAGALDVPTAWRKSLGVDRDLFSGLFADDDRPEVEESTPRDVEEDDSADKLS